MATFGICYVLTLQLIYRVTQIPEIEVIVLEEGGSFGESVFFLQGSTPSIQGKIYFYIHFILSVYFMQ